MALENDDMIFTPQDVIRASREIDVPFTYDVHHHRIKGDALSIEEATSRSIASWRDRGMEPCFHLSSSMNPNGTRYERRKHSEFIDRKDLPECWLRIDGPITIIIESKGREAAVQRFRSQLPTETELI